MLIDDVFSGIDNVAEEQIFSRLLSKGGLLRSLGITVILVTNGVHRLRYADRIIALDVEGKIDEQGKFEDLIQNDKYISGLLRRCDTQANETAVNSECKKEKHEDDIALQNAAGDIRRPIRDLLTYKYYFESLGLRDVLVWVVLMICYSMLLQFPSRLSTMSQ